MSKDVDPVELEHDNQATHEAGQGEGTHTSDSTSVLALMAQVTESISQGNIRQARRLLSHITETHDHGNLTESERDMISRLRHQLNTDPVELFLPLIFLGIWALIFWLTLH